VLGEKIRVTAAADRCDRDDRSAHRQAKLARSQPDDVARRRLDACREEIRKVRRHHQVLAVSRSSSWAVRELRALALPYYDHDDFKPAWMQI